MSERTYLIYWNGSRRTWDELETIWTIARVHPEIRRRLRALFDAAQDAGLDGGIGEGARSAAQQAAAYARDPGNFVRPGNSYHEDDAYVDHDGTRWAVAVDAVPPGNARTWMKQNAGRFGLKAVDDDWHLQPVELPNSRRLYLPGTHFVGTWDLGDSPGGPSPHTPLPDPTPPPPPSTGRTITVNLTLTELRQGASGPLVASLQRILNEKAGQGLAVDGQFGPATHAAVENWQRFFGLGVDGVVGPKTWNCLLTIFLTA
jgi:hypothetical protein